jgi:PAS domain S-box-containing protein
MQAESDTAYLLRAIDAFPQRLVVISREFRILASRGHLRATADAEIVGRLCHEVFFQRSDPCGDCAVKTVWETGLPAWSQRREDISRPETVSCLFAYPLLAGGEVEAVVSMDLNLPPATRVEEQLQRSNALLRNLITSALDGVIAADRRGKLIIFNDVAAHIFGYTIDEALERLDVRNIYPDGLEREVMRQLRSDAHGGRGKLRAYQVEILHRDGTRIPIHLNAAIVYEGAAEVATIGFFHDMRETLRMKTELEKTQLQLLQSEKMASLGKLAAGVAHQLNNPLGGIVLFTKLILEDYDLPPGACEDLDRVLHDAERCRETVKELLEFTRQTRHLMRAHDVNQSISRTLFLLKSQSLFQDIDIATELDPRLPTVHSDIQQMNHMFMNIILNAAQAMDGRGQLTIRTAHVPESGCARIEVADTGPGIPADVLPHIFEPFFTTKDEGQGTGLGLSLVYGIVENHGGRIKAYSEPGQGARFVIELPLTPKADGDPTREQDS